MELEENLKNLKEITEYLKIVRSLPIRSLSFLKNLETIRGESLVRQDYSLLIIDNGNLKDLWTFENNTINGKKRISLLNGRVSVHMNPNLCYAKIVKMKEYMDIKNLSHFDEDVSKTSNGDKADCGFGKLDVNITDIDSKLVKVEFENIISRLNDHRFLYGYLIYYRESYVYFVVVKQNK